MDITIKVVVLLTAIFSVLWCVYSLIISRAAALRDDAYLAALDAIRAQIASDCARIHRFLETQEAKRLQKESREAKIRLEAFETDAGDAQARIDISRILDAAPADRREHYEKKLKK